MTLRDGSERPAIQFSSEHVGIEGAIARARSVDVGGFNLRLAGAGDLLVLELAVAEDPSRRPSKRRRDLLDIITLAEGYPEAAAEISGLALRVEGLAAKLLTVGPSR